MTWGSIEYLVIVAVKIISKVPNFASQGVDGTSLNLEELEEIFLFVVGGGYFSGGRGWGRVSKHTGGG